MVACKEVAWEIHCLKKLVTVDNWVVEKVVTEIQKLLLAMSLFFVFLVRHRNRCQEGR